MQCDRVRANKWKICTHLLPSRIRVVAGEFWEFSSSDNGDGPEHVCAKKFFLNIYLPGLLGPFFIFWTSISAPKAFYSNFSSLLLCLYDFLKFPIQFFEYWYFFISLVTVFAFHTFFLSTLHLFCFPKRSLVPQNPRRYLTGCLFQLCTCCKSSLSTFVS